MPRQSGNPRAGRLSVAVDSEPSITRLGSPDDHRSQRGVLGRGLGHAGQHTLGYALHLPSERLASKMNHTHSPAGFKNANEWRLDAGQTAPTACESFIYMLLL